MLYEIETKVYLFVEIGEQLFEAEPLCSVEVEFDPPDPSTGYGARCYLDSIELLEPFTLAGESYSAEWSPRLDSILTKAERSRIEREALTEILCR